MVNISIVIPNLNGAESLPLLFESLIIALENINFEIILVDNNSTDNSLDILNFYFLQNKIILNPSNFGFAKAVNQGIEAAKYEYVCLLNNDLNIHQDFFKNIIKEITPNIPCYCGTVMNSNGTKIESQGISFNFNGSCNQNNHSQIFLPKLPPYPVWGSSGAAVIYNKQAIQKICLFDESFFAYIEDVDLAFRLRQPTICVPQAIVYHYGGKTSISFRSFREFYTFRNWIKFILKNYSFYQLINNFPFLLVERLRNLSYLLKSFIK
jgi:GT2 family glycosyltransferase